MLRLSHSQVSNWKNCRRQWYLSYIKKIVDNSDKSYALAGNSIHNTIDYYYKNKITLQQTKEVFDKFWHKYNLENSMLKDKKDNYWSMVLNAINLRIELTDTEMKIYYPDFVSYIDGVNTNIGMICDWKSSTVSDDNKNEYLQQLKTYSWMYYRKFNTLPKVCKCFYLKHSNKVLEYHPSIEDINMVESEMQQIQNDMEEAILNNNFPKCCDDMSKCNYFCPYKDLCFGNNKIVFKLLIKNGKIFIKNILTPLLIKALKKGFSYEVQGAHWVRQNSKWDGIVRCYNEHSQSVSLGFKDTLLKILQDYCNYKNIVFDYEIEDERNKLLCYDVFPEQLNEVVLRDYQNEAVQTFLNNKIGVLQIATSGGKTEISFEIIRRLKLKTLFVVNRKELLYQTKERMEKAFGFEIGVIGDGVVDEKIVTVATIQTLAKDFKKFKNYLNTIQLVICDECHNIPSKSFRQLFNNLPNTHYRLGLSATSKRDDGNDLLIVEGCGSIIYDLSSKKLIEQGYIMMPTIKFYHSVLCDDTKNYKEDYENNIINNVLRNDMVVKLVGENIGKKILILTKNVSHGKMFNDLIPNSFHLHGGVGKKKRQEEYEKFKEQVGGVLIATMSIASEGLNIPSLAVIINAGANKGDIKSVQMLGRVLRMVEGKKEALYIDFLDKGKHTKKHSKARYNIFIEEGHNIEVIN